MNSFIDYIPNVLHWNLEILSQKITIKCAIIPKVSLLRHIYKNVKIFILSFKINIFAFTNIVLEQRYCALDVPFPSLCSFSS